MPDLPTGTVTFLFTDIEGSTKRWEHHPDAMREALARHNSLLRSVITARGGFVFKMVGDAVYAAFAVPADAVAAVIAGQRAVAAEQWGEVGPLRVRMALHTGAAQHRDDDYFGPTLNRVARVLSTGYGGQVLLSAATLELVRDALPADVSVQDLGEHALKDLLRPEHIFQLTIPDVPSDFPALKSLSRRPHNLPVQPTPFLGRQQEVVSVCALLRRPEVRLLTLTGPGGVGKTRLSLQVAAELADQFADGMFFVALAPLSGAELVVPTIMQTLSISDSDTQPPLVLLKTALRDKHLLLLLDNFEQVEDAAVVVAELLAACPKLTVLVTSRVVLRVQAEREFAVPPLSLPDLKRLPDLVMLSQYEAVALFIERAQAVKADFQVTNANAPAVAGICTRLDGLPLAIELAAARAKYFPPQSLLARLEHGLAVLTGGARDLPTRQQTLRGAIAWSYDLLSSEEQQLFRRLAVFVDGCTIEAAEVVCRAAGELAGDILDGLLSLVDKSLLRQEESTEGEPRFGMLQLLREFGLECLRTAGEEDYYRHRHASYYADLTQTMASRGVGEASLVRDISNVLAALQWTVEHEETTLGLRLARYAQLWFSRHLWSDAEQWLERMLALDERAGEQRAPLSLRLEVLFGFGQYLLSWGKVERAEAMAREMLDLAQRALDHAGMSMALAILGQLAQESGKIDEAVTYFAESYTHSKLTENISVRGRALLNLAEGARLQGDITGAMSLLEEALATARARGFTWGVANVTTLLGRLARQQGNYALAKARYREGLALHRTHGSATYSAWCLEGLTEVLCAEGRFAQAARLCGAAAALREQAQSPLPPSEREIFEQTVALAKAELDENTFTQEWSAGSVLSQEEVVDYALSDACA